MTRRSLRRDLDVFAEIYNDAWKRNFGFVPYTKEDLDAYAQEMQLVFDSDWFMVAEIDGEAVGVAITVPDVNQALRRMNGRLLPLGWWHFLRKKQLHRPLPRRLPRRQARVPAHRRGGAAVRRALRPGRDAASIDKGEMGWILETNKPMNRAMEAMHGRIVKKYRVYERRSRTFPAAPPTGVLGSRHGSRQPDRLAAGRLDARASGCGPATGT